MRREHCALSIKAKDRSVDIRLSLEHAYVVRQIARRKIIRAVHDNVVLFDNLTRVRAREPALVQLERNVWVHITQAVPGRFEFLAANILRPVQKLPMEIAKIDIVKIDNPDCADAGRGQVKRRRRAESAGTDAKHARALELALPLWPDLRHHQVPRIAHPLFLSELNRVAHGVARSR